MEYALNQLPVDTFHADCCFVCEDSSMTKSGIAKGDVVFIDSEAEIREGDIAALTVAGKTTLARVWIQDEYILLGTDNPLLTAAYVGAEREQVKVIGKAVCVNHRLNVVPEDED